MGKIKNWWNKSYTRGDLLKSFTVGMVLSCAIANAVNAYIIDSWKKNWKVTKF